MIILTIVFITLLSNSIAANTIKNDQTKKQTTEATIEKKVIPQKKEANQPKTITIANNIEPEMLKYKHWTGTYEPTFNITINGKAIDPGKKVEINPVDQTLEVQYNYSFMSGYKKGKRKVTFEVPKDTKDVALTFSWDDKYRVIADNATPVSIKKVKK